MALVDDQKVVEAFTSHGPDKTLANAFARGARTGVLITLAPMSVNTDSNAAVNFASAIADQEPDGGGPLAEVHDKVACMLRDPRTGRMTCNAQDVHASGVDFDHEEHIQPSQQDGVDVEEVASQQPTRLRSSGTAATSDSDSRGAVSASDRLRRGSDVPCPPPPGTRAGPLHLEFGGIPIAGSPPRAAAPDHGFQRRSADVRACSGKSTARQSAGDAGREQHFAGVTSRNARSSRGSRRASAANSARSDQDNFGRAT